MNGEYMSLETAKRVRRYNILLKRIRILKKENERLHSIIKEVREYIEQNDNKEPWKSLNGKELLEILDKENKK